MNILRLKENKNLFNHVENEIKEMYEYLINDYEVTDYEEADYLLYEYYRMGLISKEDLEYYYDDDGITFKRMEEEFNKMLDEINKRKVMNNMIELRGNIYKIYSEQRSMFDKLAEQLKETNKEIDGQMSLFDEKGE